MSWSFKFVLLEPKSFFSAANSKTLLQITITSVLGGRTKEQTLAIDHNMTDLEASCTPRSCRMHRETLPDNFVLYVYLLYYMFISF